MSAAATMLPGDMMSSSKFASVPQEPLNCDEWLFACFQAFATIRRRQFVIADRWDGGKRAKEEMATGRVDEVK